MGPNNAFYLNDKIVPTHYNNLYGIAFNSSNILIRSNSASQKMSIFIIPFQNCKQHSFYGMSKNYYKIDLNTTSVNYNIKACGFSPFSVKNQEQTVSVGFKNSPNSNGQIFYGINENTNLEANSNYLSAQMNDIDEIIDELGEYLAMKKKYKIKALHSNDDKDDPRNLLGNICHFDGKSSYHFLQKNEDEEKYFNSNFKFKNSKGSLLNRIQSAPSGFSNSDKFSSEVISFNINSPFYSIYEIKSLNSSSNLLLERKFSTNLDDDSITENRCDFLLYYDSQTTKFTYDNAWISDSTASDSPKKAKINYKLMQILVASVIILVSIILVFVVVNIVNSLKRRRICCFKTKNLSSDFDSEPRSSCIDANRSRCRRANNSNAQQEVETICYLPNLDDQIAYKNYNETNNERKSSSLENCINSDSYTYEYDAGSCSDDYSMKNNPDNDDEASQNMPKVRTGKLRKKIKRIDLANKSISKSPYDINIESTTSIEDIKFLAENSENDERHDKDRNLPNPYGLPPSFLSAEQNDQNDDQDDNSKIINI